MENSIQENIKKLEELKEAAKPLIKYLCENYHPHVTAIVTPTSIEVMEGVQAASNITEFIVD
jgi:ABC-type phosphate/phosphonate transport system substrate-binding protein